MTKELEKALRHIKTRADLWAVREVEKALSQKPCAVSVSEKEPNEISEEVTMRFFKNSLKVRWHDFVIYNAEWLKKNWQTEMEIVCGVKPCDDAISRDAVDKYIARLLSGYLYDGERERLEIFSAYLWELPSVTQKSGKWIALENRFELGSRVRCSNCGQVFVVGDDVSRHFCPNCGARMAESEDKK